MLLMVMMMRLDLNMEWGMNKVPDMNFNTAENGHFKATAVGHNARWGDYSVNRDLTWESGNRKFAATMTGSASFGAGALHASSPIVTDINFSYDMAATDLEFFVAHHHLKSWKAVNA